MRVHVIGNDVETRPLLIAANHISWTDIMALGVAGRRHLHRQVRACRLAADRHAVAAAAHRLHRARAQAQVRRPGQRDRPAAGRRRRHGAVCRGHDRRRQPAAAVQEHAVRRCLDGDCRGCRRRCLHPAGGDRLHAHPWHADGAPAPADRRWIGDKDLVPHISGVARRGRARRRDLHFGEPIEFSARVEPQGSRRG